MTTGYILTVGAECLRDLSTTEATRVRSQTTGVHSGNNLGLTTKTMESYWCTSQAAGVITLDIVSTNNFVHKVTGADVEGINISMDDGSAGSTIPLSSCSSRSRTRIPPRCSRDERQAVEDSIRTLSGTHTSHLESKNACSEWDFSKLRSKYFSQNSLARTLRVFSRKPGTPWTPCFTAFRQYTEKSWGSNTRISKKLPHLASSWARLA